VVVSAPRREFDIHLLWLYRSNARSYESRLRTHHCNSANDHSNCADRVTTKGNRSTLIDRAIRCYVKTRRQQNLRERLKQEALADTEWNLHMTVKWFPLEDESKTTLRSL